MSGAAGIEYVHSAARLRQTPSDGQANHASPDDRYGRLGLDRVAPFAGMIQTGSVGMISACTGAGTPAVHQIGTFVPIRQG